jgi:plastocyanin
MHGRRSIAIGIALLALTVLGAACGGGDEEGGADGVGDGGTADVTLTVKDFAFDPATLDVSAGEQTITVTNTGAVEHSFTLDDDSVSQDVEAGESATVTFEATGTIGFHCKYHPDTMKGTLTVS